MLLLERPPMIKDNTNSTKKIKNKILAMDAAPAATPPNPNIAATMATIKNITVQRNITHNLIMNKLLSPIPIKELYQFFKKV